MPRQGQSLPFSDWDIAISYKCSHMMVWGLKVCFFYILMTSITLVRLKTTEKQRKGEAFRSTFFLLLKRSHRISTNGVWALASLPMKNILACSIEIKHSVSSNIHTFYLLSLHIFQDLSYYHAFLFSRQIWQRLGIVTWWWWCYFIRTQQLPWEKLVHLLRVSKHSWAAVIRDVQGALPGLLLFHSMWPSTQWLPILTMLYVSVFFFFEYSPAKILIPFKVSSGKWVIYLMFSSYFSHFTLNVCIAMNTITQ